MSQAQDTRTDNDMYFDSDAREPAANHITSVTLAQSDLITLRSIPYPVSLYYESVCTISQPP